jgi:hypothetical protein
MFDKWQQWVQQRAQQGQLGIGGDKDLYDFASEYGIGERGVSQLRRYLFGGQRSAEVHDGWYKLFEERKKQVDRSKNQHTENPYFYKKRKDEERRQKKQAWTGWGPVQASRQHNVDGWEWNQRLSAYVATETPDSFMCKCGAKLSVPGYHNCKCGKIWNSYVIGTGGENRQAAVEKYLCREVPVRDNVIVANKKRTASEEELASGVGFERWLRLTHPDKNLDHNAFNRLPEEERRSFSQEYNEYVRNLDQKGKMRLSRKHQAKGKCECWEGYERVPGTKPCAEGSCRKCDGHRKAMRQAAKDSCPACGKGIRDYDLSGTVDHRGQKWCSGCLPDGIKKQMDKERKANLLDALQQKPVGNDDDGEDFATDAWPSDHHPDNGNKLKSTPDDWHRRDKNQRWTGKA